MIWDPVIEARIIRSRLRSMGVQDSYIDTLNSREALTLVFTEDCIQERMREEREMQAMANQMTQNAQHYMSGAHG